MFRLVSCLWNEAFWLVPFPLFWLVDGRSIEVFVFCPFKNGMVNVPKLPCIGGILCPIWLVKANNTKTRPMGFKYQKGYDWLDSKFQCSYLESRGVPEKPREIISLSFPVTSFPMMQFPVMQLPVTSLLHTAPPQMGFEMSPYTTYIFRIFQYSHLNYTIPAVTVTLTPGFNHW